MGKKRAKRKNPYLLSNFDHKLLMRVRSYAFNKDIYIWQAFEDSRENVGLPFPSRLMQANCAFT